MKVDNTYIILREVRFHAFHGVMPQERKVGADFVVSLKVGVDLSRPVVSDEVGDTLNYATLYEVVKKEMEIPSHLLEHVAGRIVRSLMHTFPAMSSIDLWLTKVTPPMGADSEGAGVEIHLINDKTD